MTTENLSLDPYEAVIADLQAKRDQIDQTINLLNALRGSGQSPISYASVAENPITETAGMFLGMSIVDAGKKLLAMQKRTMGNSEIARELQSGGMVFSGKDPVNVVGSVLTRRFNDVGDVVKVGRGIWGLKEWYPGRNFKPAARAAMVDQIIEETLAKPALVEPPVETTWREGVELGKAVNDLVS